MSVVFRYFAWSAKFPRFNGVALCTRYLSGASQSHNADHSSSQTDKSPNSSYSDSVEDTDAAMREQILKASMKFIPQYGWSIQALAAGAESLSLPAVAHGMFPRGGMDLIHYFYTDCNNRLSDWMIDQTEAKEGHEKPHTAPLIRDAVHTRLSMIIPHLQYWPQAMSISVHPENLPQALSNLADLVDEIWYRAGDKSTDFNWYTKRASLAAVYKSTEIFLVQDESEDQQETWRFLDRRMTDLNKLSTCFKNLQKNTDGLTNTALGMSILVRNVLGLNTRYR